MKGDSMRQSSEHFMDEMLKSTSAPKTEQTDQFDQIAKVLDEKIDNAMNKLMEKFSDQVSQVNEPEDDESHDQVETPEETIEINQDGANENGNDTDG